MANDDQKPLSLNKQGLAKALSEQTGLSGSVSADVVETLFDIMARTVATGGSVSVTNFLSMERVDKDPRIARNPHTGESIQIPSRRAIRVHIAPRLRDFANSDHPEKTTIRKMGKGAAKK